jgi:hypothetical protein
LADPVDLSAATPAAGLGWAGAGGGTAVVVVARGGAVAAGGAAGSRAFFLAMLALHSVVSVGEALGRRGVGASFSLGRGKLEVH